MSAYKQLVGLAALSTAMTLLRVEPLAAVILLGSGVLGWAITNALIPKVS